MQGTQMDSTPGQPDTPPTPLDFLAEAVIGAHRRHMLLALARQPLNPAELALVVDCSIDEAAALVDLLLEYQLGVRDETGCIELSERVHVSHGEASITIRVSNAAGEFVQVEFPE